MTRKLALPVTLIVTAIAALATDDRLSQNQSADPESFDIEPPLLKQNLSDQPLPVKSGPNGDVARLEKKLENAKTNAAGAERLCIIGVRANVDVQPRVL